jgi:hypothetical protein
LKREHTDGDKIEGRDAAYVAWEGWTVRELSVFRADAPGGDARGILLTIKLLSAKRRVFTGAG